MTEPLTSELPLLTAIEQAVVEHDAWLASIGTGTIDGVNKDPHPFACNGAPAAEVAQVLFHGETEHVWRKKWMLARGIRTFARSSERLRDEFRCAWQDAAPWETASERARTVAMLLRAERLGLVERVRPKTARGGDVGITYWRLSG